MLTVLLTALAAVPIRSASADRASVSNTMSVSSASGGNSADSGEVIQGKTESSANVETTVNGEIIQFAAPESNGGAVRHEYRSDDGSVDVTTVIKTSGNEVETPQLEETGVTVTNKTVSRRETPATRSFLKSLFHSMKYAFLFKWLFS